MEPFSFPEPMFGLDHFERQFRAMDSLFDRPQFGDWDVEPAGDPRGSRDPHAPQGPQYYISSTTSTMLPGGVCETHRRVRRNGRETEEHSRAIGDRRVVQKRERDLATGREDRRRDIYHMEEDEIDAFDQEFREQRDGRGLAGDSWWGRALRARDEPRARGDRALTGAGAY